MNRRLRLLLGSTMFALALPAFSATALAQGPETLVRLNALEEQVRDLNGRIEELNFVILQLQEQVRRQKEDNDIRFQDLEAGSERGSLGTSDGDEIETDMAVVEDEIGDETVFAEPDGAGSTELGAPPRDLGTLPVDGTVTGSLELPAEFATDDELIGTISSARSPEALFDRGYEFVLAGEHARAEQVFLVHRRRYPDAPSAPQATLWLGESVLAQDRAEEAAEILLDGHESYPDSSLAAEMLFKVGVAMAALGNRDIACATFDEVTRRYPSLPPRTTNRIAEESVSASC